MSAPRNPSNAIDWPHLAADFDDFEADAALNAFDPQGFVRSLIDPVPEFVEVLLDRRRRRQNDRPRAVRDLYGFLLEKRYHERLNLLHFAFEIFDDGTCLPEEIIAQTPFPHEEGLPRYRHRLEPGFKLAISSD